MKNYKILAFTAALSITAGGFLATEASAEKYTIQAGDTLYKISQQFDTTIESLKQVNNLTSDLIYAADTIEVSSKGKVYIIEPNDTLFKIAAAHNVSVEQLKAWNGLGTDLIYAGEAISVSGPSQATQAQAQQQTTAAVAPKQVASSEKVASTVPVASTKSAATQAPSSAAKTMTVEATAYTAFCTGCSGVTTNGTDLRSNPSLKVIAVDPSVIPLGTKVWVEGYGEAIAADTGGAIKGNRIDVFIPSKEDANQWGRRTVTIKF